MKKVKTDDSNRRQDHITVDDDPVSPAVIFVNRENKPFFDITLLGKIKVEAEVHIAVEKRLATIYPYLIEGAQYSAEDLMAGSLGPDLPAADHPIVVYCLKHLAQSGTMLREVRWGIFEAVIDTKAGA